MSWEESEGINCHDIILQMSLSIPLHIICIVILKNNLNLKLLVEIQNSYGVSVRRYERAVLWVTRPPAVTSLGS